MKWLQILSVIWVVGALPLTAWASPSPKRAAKQGFASYQAGELDEALRLLQYAASSLSEFEPKQRAALFKYIALCHVGEGRSEEAQFAFKQALHHQADFSLDGDRMSPKVMQVFEQAKREWELLQRVSELVAKDPKRDAAGALWRSAAAPGWGQRYSSRPVAGYLATGANAAALTWATYWTIAALRAETLADRVRLSGTGPYQVQFLQQAREYRVRRNVALGVAAGIYALTLIDAAVVPAVRQSRFTVRGGVVPTGGFVQLEVRF